MCAWSPPVWMWVIGVAGVSAMWWLDRSFRN